MVFDARYGLAKGINTRTGRRMMTCSNFIDNLVNVCGENDYLIVRGFTPSPENPLFDPKVVLIGWQCDHTLILPEGTKKYFVPRVESILEKLITRNSIIIGEGGARELTLKDRGLFDSYPFSKFIGSYKIKLVDNPELIIAKAELELQGIDCWNVCVERNIKEYILPGILDSVKKTRNKTFVVIDGGYFIRNQTLLTLLEESNVSYVLLCPKQVFLLKTSASNACSLESIWQQYCNRINEIANAQYITSQEQLIINQILKKYTS